jgi:hypothetical protein
MGEYTRRIQDEAKDVQVRVNDPSTVVAHVVYPTG